MSGGAGTPSRRASGGKMKTKTKTVLGLQLMEIELGSGRKFWTHVGRGNSFQLEQRDGGWEAVYNDEGMPVGRGSTPEEAIRAMIAVERECIQQAVDALAELDRLVAEAT